MNIDNLTITECIKNKSELNFTGKYWIEQSKDSGVNTMVFDTHSPLTYCIEYQEKELFQELLDNGADINYAIDDWEWTPLLYALQSSDEFYLKTLLNRKEIDLQQSIQGKNAFIKILGSPLLLDYCITNVLSAIKEYPVISKLLSDDKPILGKISDNQHLKKIINEMPSDWLVEQLNEDFNMSSKLLEKFSTEKKVLNKIIKSLIPNKADKGQTVFSTFVENYLNNLSEYKKQDYEEIVLRLLKKGHNPQLPENSKALSVLEQKEFYKKYTIIKNYIKLSEGVQYTSNSHARKVKI